MVVFVLSWIGIGCWGVCFWWMHRISARQDAMLKELHEVMRRVEKTSETGRDLIREVHPQVGAIKEHVEDVKDAVKPEKTRGRDRRT